jgi:hypothetical protein
VLIFPSAKWCCFSSHSQSHSYSFCPYPTPGKYRLYCRLPPHPSPRKRRKVRKIFRFCSRDRRERTRRAEFERTIQLKPPRAPRVRSVNSCSPSGRLSLFAIFIFINNAPRTPNLSQTFGRPNSTKFNFFCRAQPLICASLFRADERSKCFSV